MAQYGCLLEFPTEGDILSQGNIVFTSFSFLEYCNSIHSISSLSTVVNSNYGPIAVDESDSDIVSAVTEGPFKLLYNAISFAMYCRAYAGTVLDTRSSLFNYVGEWNSSWVMDENALLEKEKEEEFTNISITSIDQTLPDTDSLYVKDLLSNYLSVEDFYVKSIYSSLPSYQVDKIKNIDLSNTEFFIEVTNPDVIVAAAIKVPNSLETYNIPSSYNLFKLSNSKQKAYAFTETVSPKINIPDGFGPYCIKNIAGIKSSNTRKLDNEIDPVNSFESYPFNLETFYSYQTATDKPLNFSGNYSANIKLYYKGTAQVESVKKAGTVVRRYQRQIGTTPVVPIPVVPIPGLVSSFPCQDIDSLLYRMKPTGQIKLSAGYQWRSNDYTWDTEEGNAPRYLDIGSSGDYVKYIQSALKSGGFYNSTIDGTFGQVTKSAVAAFQNFMKTFKPVWTTNGVVDNETKDFIAFCIINNINSMARGRDRRCP